MQRFTLGVACPETASISMGGGGGRCSLEIGLSLAHFIVCSLSQVSLPPASNLLEFTLCNCIEGKLIEIDKKWCNSLRYN